jgi:KaiC/GvpD/RAD55 family RecA-like ATPase
VIYLNGIPSSLREKAQWVLWKTAARRQGDKPTKLPFQVNGHLAAANDPGTWTTFEEVRQAYDAGGYSGIGFEFSKDDPLCGIDLDGCRNSETGKVEPWARETILAFNTYAEVSPSKTGVKLFLLGKSPFASGRKKELKDQPTVADKAPAVEVYDWGRYFAVTGMRLQGMPVEPQARQQELEALIARFFPDEPASVQAVDFRSEEAILERARKYLAKLPPAISGQSGHNATFHAACVLVLGFELPEADALGLLHEYNQRCEPPWSERELEHKVRQAAKQPGQRGYLRYASPERWSGIAVPRYAAIAEPLIPEPRVTMLVNATKDYIDSIADGKTSLLDLGLGEVSYAVGGGVERGEMVIFAARPGHGKSAVALQCVHHWTSLGLPCAIVSEEMSALALGKRTLQYVTRVPDEHWSMSVAELRSDLDDYAEQRAPCVILEGCGTAEGAAVAVEKVVREFGVQCVVVDYAQLLRSVGRTRYEQVTNTSIMLRQLASREKLVLLVLCQLSRAIENRTEFAPVMSDLKDTGQLEQDADVIVFLVWPWRLDPSQDQKAFQFYVAKVRNRAINQRAVTCRFLPSRQMFVEPVPELNGSGVWEMR